MLSRFVSEHGSSNTRVHVLGVAVLSVVGGWSLDRVAWLRSGDFATESGRRDSGLVLGSPELRGRRLIDLLDTRSVVTERGSLDGGVAATEANRGALVSELRADVLDVRSAEGVAEFGAVAAEGRTAGAISELGSVDTKAGLRSEGGELRLGSTETELDSGASVLEGAVVGDMGLLAFSSLGGAIGAGVVTAEVALGGGASESVGSDSMSLTVNSVSLNGSLLPSVGNHGDGGQSGDSEHLLLV